MAQPAGHQGPAATQEAFGDPAFAKIDQRMSSKVIDDILVWRQAGLRF